MRWLIVFIFLMLIAITSIVSAIEIGISPGELNFNGKPMEVVCNKVTVYSSQDITLTGSDKWANSSKITRDMKDYKFEAKDLGISIAYLKEVKKNNTEIKICLGGIKPGVYQGALIYSTPTTAGVGTWINVNIGGQPNLKAEENSKETKETTKITEAVIGTENLIYLPMIFSTIVLFIVLIMLMKIDKRLRKEKEGVSESINQEKHVENNKNLSDNQPDLEEKKLSKNKKKGKKSI